MSFNVRLMLVGVCGLKYLILMSAVAKMSKTIFLQKYNKLSK